MAEGIMTSFQTKLAIELKEHKTRWGSFKNLAKRIGEANGVPEAEKTPVDRRKLAALVEGEEVLLSSAELQALDVYLSTWGNGLAALFAKPSIVKMLAATGEMTFLMGSRPRPEHKRIDMSRWDILAMRELLLAIGKTREYIHFAIEDVIFDERVKPKVAFDGAGLKNSVLGEKGPSVICIGSPRACPAAEYMLAQMFGSKEFVKPRKEWHLPFYFVWSPAGHARFQSAFALGSEDVLKLDAELARKVSNPSGQTWAFVLDGSPREVDRVTRWTSYGVVAVQRRAGGQLWLVVAGLCGPGTLGAAKVAASLEGELPPTRAGECSRTLWAIAEVAVQTASVPGDDRQVTSQTLLRTPQFWPPERG